VGSAVTVIVTPRKGLTITFPAGKITPLDIPQAAPEDTKRALFDLAVVETGLQTPCFIPLGDSTAVEVGQHLISIGFPGSATSGVLYEGFLSSRSARLPLPFGAIEGHPNITYTPRYEVLRVQMPITSGASGSPIISDSNEVVGVVSEAPLILTKDVEDISEAYGGLNDASSGVFVSGFDVTKILGELAWTVAQFESSGAGLAVPISNLNLPVSESAHSDSKAKTVRPKPNIASPKSQ
jgi:S1-C subfamily serine protease